MRLGASARYAIVLATVCGVADVRAWHQDPVPEPAPADQVQSASPEQPPGLPPGLPPGTPLDDARASFEAGRFEEARERLDALINSLGTVVSGPTQRLLLSGSYELRARTRLGLRDVDGARNDFRAMLLVDPTSTLTAGAGARGQALFDETRAATVGEIAVSIAPPDAAVTLDGVPLAAVPPSLVLVGGTHTIAAARNGYRAAAQTFTIVPGMPLLPIRLVLDREFSTLTFRTAPAGVEVLVDGVHRGVTEAEASATAAHEEGTPISSPFMIEELLPGRHRLELRRECHIPMAQDVDVARSDDLTLDLVRLQPAVATVSVTSNVPNASVFVDDQLRGMTPLGVADVCEGRHVIEVRTAAGRHLRRVEVKPGEKVSFAARVRPAFALVAAPDGEAIGPLAVEAAFEDASGVTLYAPPADRLASMVASIGVPPDWLAFDVLRKPVGGAASLTDAARRAAGERLSETLGAQGVASVTRDPAGGPSDMLLALLAPGSARPDVLTWRSDSPASVRQLMARLESRPAMTRASIGANVIDVLDVAGAVVTEVASGSPAEGAGMKPGDVVVSAGGAEVAGAAHLSTLIDEHLPHTPIALVVADGAGTRRTVRVTPEWIPRVVLFDLTVLSNVWAVRFASLAASARGPFDEAGIRLNLAAAMMRLDDWSGAVAELNRVVALAGRAGLTETVSAAVAGTAHYMLGLCAEAAGDAASAEREWIAAAGTGGLLLTDGGGPVAVLAERQRERMKDAQASPR